MTDGPNEVGGPFGWEQPSHGHRIHLYSSARFETEQVIHHAHTHDFPNHVHGAHCLAKED